MKKINPDITATPWTGGTLTDLLSSPDKKNPVTDKKKKKTTKKKTTKKSSSY